MSIATSHHRRSALALARAVIKPGNYSGVVKTFRNCSKPIDFLKRYVRNAGEYPTQVKIRTPIGPVTPTAFLPDDVLTINEIFFRGDYGDDRAAKVVVDFGSNIGISALYFLSRNRDCVAYCFEPLQQNIDRLKGNLRGFEGRYKLQEVAVAEADGTVEFGWEPTGRYGGIGKEGMQKISVPAADSNRVLTEIIERHGEIDLLKVDIEALEYLLTARIPQDLVRHIRRIVVENHFTDNPFAATHDMTFNHPITTLRRR
jgi:FkbM family methyltransferase